MIELFRMAWQLLAFIIALLVYTGHSLAVIGFESAALLMLMMLCNIVLLSD